MAPGRRGIDRKSVILKLKPKNISCKIVLMWTPQHFTDD